MAFDGITIANIIWELKKKLAGGRIDKIYMPEADEVTIAIRGAGGSCRLLLSANASHPRFHLTTAAKDNPAQPPLFCMVLRKHISGGRLIAITQPMFERIVCFHIEAMNEMGDMTEKQLIIEVMGKHSNIILTDEHGVIIDSIKRVPHEKSSVREVLPGRTYTYPPSGGKRNPLETDESAFIGALESTSGKKIQSIIYQSFNGISPVMSDELCYRASVDPAYLPEMLGTEDKKRLALGFVGLFDDVLSGRFAPEVTFNESNKPLEFSCVEMKIFSGHMKTGFDSASEMLEYFYKEKDAGYRVKQKTADLRKLIQANIERCVKKHEMYTKTMDDIKDRDTLRVYGELITANIYSVKKGMTMLSADNYYVEGTPKLEIPLDSQLSPSENAQKYFKQYNKQKRTYTAVIEQLEQNSSEMRYLEGVLSALDTVADESDIADIRDELASEGFVKKRRTGRDSGAKNQKQKKSKPLHYISSDGFDIYVGKNNKQNDELTLRFAVSSDIWLHTKEIPGSHVIIKTNGVEPTDTTLNEAAHLAAYYSQGKNSTLVPVDYTHKKNVKKPNGAKPGMVIYESNKTAYVTPDEEMIQGMRQSL